MKSPTAVRHARAARARSIRRRAIAAALALFVAAWLLIAVALASGHDPALSSKTTAASGSTATNTGSTATNTTPATSASQTATSSSAAAPVTTQQS